MNIEIIIAGLALFITIVVNIATISYFAGVLKSNQEHQKEVLKIFKEEINANFKRIETKQDKNNNLIERMVRVEDSAQSAHQLINEIKEVQHECILHRD